MFCYNITFVMKKYAVNHPKGQFWLSIILVVCTMLTVVAHGAHAGELNAHLETIDCKLCQHNIDVETPSLALVSPQSFSFAGVQISSTYFARCANAVVLPPLRAPPCFP